MSRKDLSCYTEANVLKPICTRSDYVLGHESREATCFEWVKLLLYYNFMYNFMFGCISAVFDTFYYLLFSSGSVSQAVMRLNCWFLLIFKLLHIVSSAYIYIGWCVFQLLCDYFISVLFVIQVQLYSHVVSVIYLSCHAWENQAYWSL